MMDAVLPPALASALGTSQWFDRMISYAYTLSKQYANLQDTERFQRDAALAQRKAEREAAREQERQAKEEAKLKLIQERAAKREAAEAEKEARRQARAALKGLSRACATCLQPREAVLEMSRSVAPLSRSTAAVICAAQHDKPPPLSSPVVHKLTSPL